MDQSTGLRMFESDTIKLDRMDGMNFTRWKKKMKFLLAAFKVYYVVEGPPIGVLTENEQRKHDQDETICRGYILRKNNKGNNKKRKGTWNSSKDNKKDKKPLSEDESANAAKQVDTTEITAVFPEMNIGMIHELHMASVITTNNWWYDSGATTHVCNNKDLFKTYKKTKDGHEVTMGDNHTSKNGVDERKNKVLQDMINAMLVSVNLPRIYGVKSCLQHVVGLKSVFVGYAKDSKSYRCLDLDSNVIVESRDVDFFENFFCHDSTSTNKIVTQILQDISSPDLNSFNKRNMVEYSSAPRRSKRARKERNLDPDFIDSQAIIFLVEDDILIVGTNMEGINETKKFLSSCFQMKDLNEVDTIGNKD
nr:retrovirus-related Pol polyprotein from transposon TNT 1-94 [Tanacetum cinerariifolium]